MRRAHHSSKESYRLCKKDYETEEEAKAQQNCCRPTNEWVNEIDLKEENLGHIYLQVKIILNWALKKQVVMRWAGWLRIHSNQGLMLAL
jgi:hypothetical protein